MIHKAIIFSLVLSFSCIQSISQSAEPGSAGNLAYLEILGAGGYASLNFERLFLIKNDVHLSFRSGLSTYNISDFKNNFNPDVIVPLALIIAFGEKHKIETGIGQTISAIVYADFDDYSARREIKTSGTISLGYRYYKPGGGMMYRLVYSPIIEFNRSFRHWAGLSVGIAFK